MPPKSSSKKKETQVAWYNCVNCEVHITAKARDTHENVCPILEDACLWEPDVEFVRHGKLFTRSFQQRNFEVEGGLKDLPGKYANALIFVSEGAIRLAGLHIGQHVVVEPVTCNDGPTTKPLVRIVWPVPENFLTTVFVSEKDFKLHLSQLRGKHIKISALEAKNVCTAERLHLRLENAEQAGIDHTQLKDVASILKHDLVHQIHAQGSSVHLNFFNKSLQFNIESWQGHPDAKETVEQALARLSLSKELQFLQITNSTSIDILLHVQEEHSQLPQLRNKKTLIGGLDRQVKLVEETMDYALGFRPLTGGIKVGRGLLLYGATGCGKSMICEAMSELAQQKVHQPSQVQILRINSGEVFSRFLGETEKNLAGYFEKVFDHYPHPTLVLLEDVHNLCPRNEASSEVVKRVSLAFLTLLDQLNGRREGQRTFLLATTSQLEALHPSIRRAGRFDCEVELEAPDPLARQAILRCLLANVEHQLSSQDIEHIAAITHGYVGADLANLVYTATLAALKGAQHQRPLELAQLQAALTHVKPSAMREVLIENPNIKWDDIGGQSALKLTLQQAIEWPLLHPEKFQRLGIQPPRGILMFGPPGCSKTMIAKALATESHLNFLSIKGPELFSMWVGESERAVREVFRKARQVAPSIVFFDEIDAIGGERSESGGSSGSSVKERVLTQLLTELDGVVALNDVTIVAATNRPDMIDKALLRPGRIDRIVYVGLPNAEARLQIFRIKLRAMPLDSDVDLAVLVERTDGYSGAEIQAVCHEAALRALELSFEAEQVRWEHFEYALQAVPPRTSPELLTLYQDYLKQK